MATEFERDREERRAIKKETKPALRLGLIALLAVALCTALARFITIGVMIPPKTRETLFGIFILAIIMIMVAILAARKTIYYSSRLIRDDFTLTQVLRKWKTIDRTLISITGVIPVMGLILTWLGLPFSRTWFIFLVSALLLIILMPMDIKVRGKLMILRDQNPNLNI